MYGYWLNAGQEIPIYLRPVCQYNLYVSVHLYVSRSFRFLSFIYYLVPQLVWTSCLVSLQGGIQEIPTRSCPRNTWGQRTFTLPSDSSIIHTSTTSTSVIYAACFVLSVRVVIVCLPSCDVPAVFDLNSPCFGWPRPEVHCGHIVNKAALLPTFSLG